MQKKISKIKLMKTIEKIGKNLTKNLMFLKNEQKEKIELS